MNEEGDTPSGSQSAQSNPMDSLNDEITPKSHLPYSPHPHPNPHNYSTCADKSYHIISVVDKLENELKMRSKENDLLKSRISQLEGEAQSMIDNLKKTEVMIRAKFTDMSKLTEEKVYSQRAEYDGVTWKMSVHKDCSNVIWFYLVGEKENEVEWFCPVITEFLMFSQKSKGIVHRYERKLIYDAKKSSQSIKIISHENLFNEEKGFVNNDSIIVAVAIRAHPRIINEFPEVTIHSKFTDISKLTSNKTVFSEPTEHTGVTWKMSVYKDGDNDIMFFLHGEKENDVDWIYLVIAEFRLISQKSQEIIDRNDRKLIYDAKNSVYWINYISPEDLFNEEKGFIKDDSIIVAVTITGIPTD